MQGLWPQKNVNLSNLVHVGENLYSLGGTEILATEVFTDTYDRIIGIDSRQRKMVKEASGETGLTNYRNYINVASNMQESKSVVVIASPQSQQLTEIIPIVDEYISPTLFFDFAEMMAEETDYIVADIKFDNAGKPCASIIFVNPQGRTHMFGPGENFMMDGFYLTWNLSSIELGHYHERMVCANGLTVNEERKDFTVYKLSSYEIRKMIELVKNNHFFVNGIDKLSTGAFLKLEYISHFEVCKLDAGDGIAV